MRRAAAISGTSRGFKPAGLHALIAVVRRRRRVRGELRRPLGGEEHRQPADHAARNQLLPDDMVVVRDDTGNTRRLDLALGPQSVLDLLREIDEHLHLLDRARMRRAGRMMQVVDPDIVRAEHEATGDAARDAGLHRVVRDVVNAALGLVPVPASGTAERDALAESVAVPAEVAVPADQINADAGAALLDLADVAPRILARHRAWIDLDDLAGRE